MKLKKKIKRIIIVLITLIVIVGIFLIYNNTVKDTNKSVPSKEEKEIKEFGYILYDNDIKLYKKEFDELVNILNKKEIDYKKYSQSISKLFAIDFYDLNSKTTSADIGGTQYIYSNNLDNFILNAKDTIYKNVESNIYNDRKQELPVVVGIKIINSKENNFTIDKKEFDGYINEIEITYKKDLNYPKSILITTIKNDKKLDIVKIETKK